MKGKILLWACSVLLLCLSACGKDAAPENEMPVLTIGEVTDIGRKTATISGSISVPQGSDVRDCGFLYSTVSSLPEAESQKVGITLQGSQHTYTATLTGLMPDTKYYYCLYAGSGYTMVRSAVREFTTIADGTPVLGGVTSLTATEVSLTLASQILDDGGSALQKYGFAYKISGSAEAEKMVEATQKDHDNRFTVTIPGLAAETTYDVRAFASNSKGTGYGDAVQLVTSAPELPLLQIESQTPGSVSVEVNARLTNENDIASSITEVGFCWSKEKEEPTIDDSKLMTQLEAKQFSAIIKELTPETKYYVRAYAINKKTKIGYSNVISFTTAKSSVPRLETVTVVSAEETTAVLQSQLLDNGGHDVTRIGFAYKKGKDGTETMQEVPLSALNTEGVFQFTLTGLAPETDYIVRSYAVNERGTGYGAEATLTTKAMQAPVLSVEAGTPNGTSVPVTALIQSAGGGSSTIKEVGFCWSSTNATPTLADGKMVSTLDGMTFSAVIAGLKPETKYYVRAYALNEAKIGYSNVVEITTAKSSSPRLEATTVVSVEETTAVLRSRLADNGGYDVTRIGFAYKKGTDGTETVQEVPLSELNADGVFQCTLTGLTPETAYTVRAFAVNNVGTGYGAESTMITKAIQAPVLSVESATPDGTSISIAALIQSIGSGSSTIKQVGFCWSTVNAVPTLEDERMTATLEGMKFSAVIAKLKSKTKYYIRAYALNETKVGYSNVVEITTGQSSVPEEDDMESPDKKD